MSDDTAVILKFLISFSMFLSWNFTLIQIWRDTRGKSLLPKMAILSR